MSERDFSIGNIKFKLNKLGIFKQFHLSRYILPIMGDIIPIASKISANKNADQFETLVPILTWMSKLPKKEAEEIFLTLLSCVEMQQAQGGWAYLANDTTLMFQDLELPTLFQVAGRAFGYNLKGFLAASPLASSAQG